MSGKHQSIVLVAHSSDLASSLARHLGQFGLAAAFPVHDPVYVERAKEMLGTHAVALHGDIKNPQTIEACIRVAEANLGPVIGLCHVLPRLNKQIREIDWNAVSIEPLRTILALMEPLLISHAVFINWLQAAQKTDAAIVDLVFREPAAASLSPAGVALSWFYTGAVESLLKAIASAPNLQPVRANLIRVVRANPLPDESSDGRTLSVWDLAHALGFFFTGAGRFLSGQVIELGEGISRHQSPQPLHVMHDHRTQHQSTPPQHDQGPIGGPGLWRTLGKVWGRMKAQKK